MNVSLYFDPPALHILVIKSFYIFMLHYFKLYPKTIKFL